MMRHIEVQYFTENEEEFANLLIEIGMMKNVAKTLVFLANVPEATSRDIERGTDLRQPEVSIGILYLSKRDWVSSRRGKAGGKGRPLKIYKLKKPMREVIKDIEGEKREEAKKKLALIRKLREYKFP